MGAGTGGSPQPGRRLTIHLGWSCVLRGLRRPVLGHGRENRQDSLAFQYGPEAQRGTHDLQPQRKTIRCSQRGSRCHQLLPLRQEMKLLALLAVGSAAAWGQSRYEVTDESPLVVLRDNVASVEAAVAPQAGGELSSFRVRR